MFPKNKNQYGEGQPETRIIQLQNNLERVRRHQRAKDARDTHSTMEELRPEITQLVEVLMTAHLVRHGNQEKDTAIAENYIDILRRVEYQILEQTLWKTDTFWQKLSSLLMTEAIDPSASDNSYPQAESVQVEYDVNAIHRQIISVVEIVKKELQNEIR